MEFAWLVPIAAGIASAMTAWVVNRAHSKRLEKLGVGAEQLQLDGIRAQTIEALKSQIALEEQEKIVVEAQNEKLKLRIKVLEDENAVLEATNTDLSKIIATQVLTRWRRTHRATPVTATA